MLVKEAFVKWLQKCKTAHYLTLNYLIQVVHPPWKTWSFSASISVIMSLSVTGIWLFFLSQALLLFMLSQLSQVETPSWWSENSHSSTVCVTTTSTLRGTYIFFLHLSQTWVSHCLSRDPEQGTSLSWLSVPVATVTDVLFNTTAGGNRLEWIQTVSLFPGGRMHRQCSSKVLHMQPHPFTVVPDESSVLCLLFHTLFIS